MPRKAFLGMLGTAAVVLTFASAAFACTRVLGSTTITSPSSAQGAPGTVITATGSNAWSDAVYTLRFLNFAADKDEMPTCMGNSAGKDVPISGPVYSFGGNIGSTTGVIPPTAQKTPDAGNRALVCFITVNNRFATGAAEFTVL
jgi:hypothetical protein